MSKVTILALSLLTLLSGTLGAVIIGNGTESSDLPCELKCFVPLTFDYHCGSNGISYMNAEEFNCARELCYPDLTLEHKGKCDSKPIAKKFPKKFNPVSSKSKQGTSKGLSNKNTRNCSGMTDCSCNYHYAPICGSNGVSYMNSCMLECTRLCNRELKRLHSGTCDPVPGRPQSSRKGKGVVIEGDSRIAFPTDSSDE